MSEILSYFGEVIVLTAVSGILFAVAPEGNVKKYINFMLYYIYRWDTCEGITMCWQSQ